MTHVLDQVREHLRAHFAQAGFGGLNAEPDSASVTFLGTQPIEVLRFRPGADGLVRYVSLGCSRHPMTDPTQILVDQERGPRAEVVLCLRDPGPVSGLARSLAILAEPPRDPVSFIAATPITATEAAWVRLKGAEAMRQAWQNDGVDVLDPNRPAGQPS